MLSEDDGNFEIGQSSTGMFFEVKQIVSSWQDVDGVSQHRTLQQSEMWDDGAAFWVSIVAAQRDLKSALASHGACYILHGIRLPHEYCAMCSFFKDSWSPCHSLPINLFLSMGISVAQLNLIH